ncbi:haloacid dehalogenase type II [Georgenia alba]|uniref:Haloacid dehalogenase type II n=1 Tax=Georgenia alba TaxID=2233858 RepID=A0ABW2QBB1_9MICO
MRTSARPVLVLDVLGTVVDQAGSMTRAVSARTGLSTPAAGDVVARWLAHVATEERAVVEGRRAFAPSHELDAEALRALADQGRLAADDVAALADTSARLAPWPDSVAGLDALAEDVTVVGLSNASRRTLTGLAGHARLRWHQLLSAEEVGTYKPDPALYALALRSVPVTATPVVMAAAHAWDLRAAAQAGLRTAYVPRPGGDPPGPEDHVDLHVTDLAELHARIRELARAGDDG